MGRTLIAIVLFVIVGHHVHSQIVNIPDVNFKNALVYENVADLGNSIYEDVDTNNDGEIQVSEAEAVIGLYVGNREIYSMEGIQSFVNLLELNFSENKVSSINLSQNTSLVKLYCNNNFFDALVIDQNINLEILECANNLLSTVNVSQNVGLKEIICHHNQIENIDLNNNIDLVTLLIGSNNLTNLDISQNDNLELLICGENSLNELDISQNLILERVHCDSNFLTGLDVSQNLDLTWLDVENNLITNINVSQNQLLEVLWVSNNELINLDVSQNIDLLDIRCSNNQLTNLDVSQNLNLDRLYCNINDLSSLNIKNGSNVNLTILDAQNNPNLLCIQVDDVTYANNQDCNIPPGFGWCKDETADYSEDCSLGFDESTLIENILLFPNPVQDILYIQSQNGIFIKTATFYDALGRLIFKEVRLPDQIDMSHLNRGLYFIKMETSRGSLTKEIVKE